MTKTMCDRSIAVVVLALVVFLMSGPNAVAQDDLNTLSHDVAETKVTFSAIDPYTGAPGSMTFTFQGQFHADRVAEAAGLQISRVRGEQRGAFVFVPDDSSQPDINGRFRFRFSGQPQPRMNTIHLAFRMYGRTPDGSVVGFLQHQEVTIEEEDVKISFKSSERIE